VEQKVLGFLIDPDWGGPSAVNYVLAYGITPDDFYYTEHQRLFQVLVELTKRNAQFHKDFDLTNPYPSIIHLYDKMFAGAEPLPEATTAGLKQYLLYLQSQVVSHDVFFDQVKLLKQSASDRKLLEALVKVIYHYQQTGEWDGALNQVAQALLPALEVSLERVLGLEELAQFPVSADFLWEPFLRTDGIALLVGPAGVGKSLLALWLALQICQGNPVFEGKTTPTTVLYVDAETNELVTKARVAKLTQATSLPFFYVAFNGDLFHLANYAAFVHYLQQTQPGLVILDSLIRFHTLDENKASDMKRLAIFFRELIARFHCAFLLIHHTRKTTPFGTVSDVIRGSTELRAFPDTVLILKRARGSKEMVIDIDKCRDSHELNQARFKIRLNTSGELWTYEFLGFTEEIETRIEDAMKLITQILETEPLSRKDLIARLRSEGISQRTTDRALAELKALGKVVSQRLGRQTIYRLPTEPSQPTLY
jgi:DNA-binding transcriptional ArsR family regulator